MMQLDPVVCVESVWNSTIRHIEPAILGFSISENFASLRTLREITLNHEDEWIGDVVVCCQRACELRMPRAKGAKTQRKMGFLVDS